MYTYEGENNQVEVKNSSNATPGQYSYDCDGKRVRKVAGDEVTIFVDDASGRSIPEYSMVVAPVEDAKFEYLTPNHLGSLRINTDRHGNVTARHDYHPFGEEILIVCEFETHYRNTHTSLMGQEVTGNADRMSCDNSCRHSQNRLMPDLSNPWTRILSVG